MTRTKFLLRMFFLVVFVMGGTFLAQAQTARLNSWQSKAFQYYQQEKYEDSEYILKKHPQDRFSKILLLFVHHQKWVFSQSPEQKKRWKQEKDSIRISLSISDIPYLAMIGEEQDKPKASKMAKNLLQKAFKSVNKTEDFPLLLTYLSSPDQEINRYSMNALEHLLRIRRKVVKGGGSLRPKDVVMMQNKRLLAQLTAIVSQKPVMGKNPTYPKGVNKAMDSLVLIEEPSLEVLNLVTGVKVSKTQLRIQKAIMARKKKYPNSNWYSAIGKKRG